MADRLGNAIAFASELSERAARKNQPRGATVRLVAIQVKRQRVAAGLGCEVCGWRLGNDPRVLHAHHMLPLSCGGDDYPGNVLVLCPNHHAIAHQVGKRKAYTYSGPTTRLELIRAIRLLQADVNNCSSTSVSVSYPAQGNTEQAHMAVCAS